MKIIRYVFISTILLAMVIACSYKPTDLNENPIEGSWVWVFSFSSQSGGEITPEVCQCTRFVEFNSQGEYLFYENGEITDSGKYILEQDDNQFRLILNDDQRTWMSVSFDQEYMTLKNQSCKACPEATYIYSVGPDHKNSVWNDNMGVF